MQKPNGTLEFKEFNFGKWVKIYKGRLLYRGFVFDANGNTITWTRFFNDFDECLEYTAKKHLIKSTPTAGG